MKRFTAYAALLAPPDTLVAVHAGALIVLIILRHQTIGPVAWEYAGRYLAAMAVALVAAPALEAWRHPLARHPLARWLRYFYPMMFLGPFYQWSQPVSHMFFTQSFDPWLAAADRALFGFDVARDLVYRWGEQAALTEWFNFSYLSYYWVTLYLPFYLYFTGRLREFFYVVFISGLVVFFCFFIHAFFPALGPIYYDRSITGFLSGGPVSSAAAWFMARADVPGSAMPSAHIAGTVAVWFLAWRFARPAFWLTIPVVAGLCIATVYCRFHYAVDGIAGVAVAAAGVSVVGPRVYERLFPGLMPRDDRVPVGRRPLRALEETNG